MNCKIGYTDKSIMIHEEGEQNGEEVFAEERPPDRNILRNPPRLLPQDSTYLNSSVPVQPEPVYQNANVSNDDKIYSLVYHMHQERQIVAGPSRTHIEDMDPAAIYARLKKANGIDVDYEDAM
ncbi:Fc receptor-like protein 1 [Erinaceus europaeus]|uniref:Fc receptor-like protein 1 n=1 Tax=Erinaceus europaeus TaxID=9365 RepID=A0ABM3YB89_ERIEU|nr:Fc receptor-like protein 1 [Erinaceus europaeus]